MIPQNDVKKTVCYLKGTYLTYSEWQSLLELYSTSFQLCLMQNVNDCIIDGLNEMIQYSYAYAFNITSHSPLRCAQVRCK